MLLSVLTKLTHTEGLQCVSVPVASNRPGKYIAGVACGYTGVHVCDEGLELRSAQYFTQHTAGIYQGSKPGKLKGLAREDESIHRVRHV